MLASVPREFYKNPQVRFCLLSFPIFLSAILFSAQPSSSLFTFSHDSAFLPVWFKSSGLTCIPARIFYHQDQFPLPKPHFSFIRLLVRLHIASPMLFSSSPFLPGSSSNLLPVTSSSRLPLEYPRREAAKREEELLCVDLEICICRYYIRKRNSLPASLKRGI